MNTKPFLLFTFILLYAGLVKAQLPDYNKRIHLLYNGIDKKLKDHKNGLYYETTDSLKKENLHSWLWPLCALIQGSNEMEAVETGENYMLPVEQAIDQYYNDQPPFPAYQDYVRKERLSSRFYDDNEWVAIAYMDAYHRNHKKKYLKVSEMIFRFISSGVDSTAGGGVYWKEGDLHTKNTCSNGPAVLVALQLYQVTKKTEYLNQALEIYRWTNQHLQSPEGLFYDNIKIPSLAIGKAFYTYNTGTMLQSNALLYKITKDKKYLAEAERIAAAGKAHFFKAGRLPNEYWFNAVMLRGYEELYRIDKNKDWISFFAEDANQIWEKERDEDNLLGTKPARRLIDQAAMIEIYARLQRLALDNKK